MPFFVSVRRLRRQKRWPLAAGSWALDSGAFTELATYGFYQTPARQYAEEARRYLEMLGQPDWIAPQDWMCEPFIVAKTGLSIVEHQWRTIESVAGLRLAGMPVIPVLQGQILDDYLRHIEMYAGAGFQLLSEPTIGVGSICRRQGSNETGRILATLSGLGLRLHGFGVKTTGVAQFSRYLVSADSMAWSVCGRRRKPFFNCGNSHKNCANCFEYAMWWRRKVLNAISD